MPLYSFLRNRVAASKAPLPRLSLTPAVNYLCRSGVPPAYSEYAQWSENRKDRKEDYLCSHPAEQQK